MTKNQYTIAALVSGRCPERHCWVVTAENAREALRHSEGLLNCGDSMTAVAGKGVPQVRQRLKAAAVFKGRAALAQRFAQLGADTTDRCGTVQVGGSERWFTVVSVDPHCLRVKASAVKALAAGNAERMEQFDCHHICATFDGMLEPVYVYHPDADAETSTRAQRLSALTRDHHAGFSAYAYTRVGLDVFVAERSSASTAQRKLYVAKR